MTKDLGTLLGNRSALVALNEGRDPNPQLKKLHDGPSQNRFIKPKARMMDVTHRFLGIKQPERPKFLGPK